MKLIGKRPPEADALRAAAADGFDEVELYLSPGALADTESAVDAVESSPVDATVVHTPHVTIDDLEEIEVAARLASTLEAYLVVHSQYLQAVHIPELPLETLDREAASGFGYGFENNPGVSVRHLETIILDRGHELVLDTAHLFMAHEDYLERIAALLEDHGDAISVVHFTDGTVTRDGVPFGDGEMDMAGVAHVLEERFDGRAVLEVMPEHQQAAREFVESVLEEQ